MVEIKSIKVMARKDKYEFEDGKEVDSAKVTLVINDAPIVLGVAKSSKDLAKYVLGLDAMEYGVDYELYPNRQK